MLDGRVKTLHPKVHGGILARRDLPEHVAALARAWHPADRPRRRQPLSVPRDRRARPAARWTTRSRTSTSAARRWCAPRRRTGSTSAIVVDPADYAGAPRRARRQRRSAVDGHALRARAQGVLAHGVLRRRDLELAHGARRRRRGGGVSRPLQPAGGKGAGPALRREPAPERGVLPRRCARRRAASPRIASCRARSCRTTTSPTAMPRGSA